MAAGPSERQEDHLAREAQHLAAPLAGLVRANQTGGTSWAAAEFNTANISPHERFAFYANAVATSWEAQRPDRTSHPFEVSLKVSDLGPILFWHAEGSPRRIRRLLRRTRADAQDHYTLVMTSGRAEFGTSGDETACMAADELWLFDMARSLTLLLSHGKVLALSVRREALDTLATGTASRHGVRVEGLVADMVRKQMQLLEASSSCLRPPEAAGVANAIIHLLAASLITLPLGQTADRLPLHVALMQVVRRFVDSNLADHDLSAEQLCQVLRVSRSTLYRLMEPHGGVAAYVQQRRLARVHALLSGTQDRRRIAELAFSHGFVSETHFSRAFRRRYGYAPREVRNGGPLLTTASEAAPMSLRDFYASWLLDG